MAKMEFVCMVAMSHGYNDQQIVDLSPIRGGFFFMVAVTPGKKNPPYPKLTASMHTNSIVAMTYGYNVIF